MTIGNLSGSSSGYHSGMFQNPGRAKEQILGNFKLTSISQVSKGRIITE